MAMMTKKKTLNPSIPKALRRIPNGPRSGSVTSSHSGIEAAIEAPAATTVNSAYEPGIGVRSERASTSEEQAAPRR